MPKINDGGYAFPTNSGLTYTGMSLRAYFAGQVLTGLISASSHPNATGPGQYPVEKWAEWSCELADALIAELAKDTTS